MKERDKSYPVMTTRHLPPSSYVLRSVLAASLILAVACESSPSPPPAERAARAAFISAQDVREGLAANDQGRDEAPQIQVYIDASKSMRGFVNRLPHQAAPPRYVTVVNELVMNTNSDVWLFGSKYEQIKSNITRKIEDPETYSGDDTPLSDLLERIEKSPDTVAVVVSDMVQSDPTRDENDLRRALAALARQKRAMELAGFRSSFSGDYWVEESKSKPLELKQPQDVPGAGRPFYVLIVAPVKNSIENAEHQLFQHVQAAFQFVPTKGAWIPAPKGTMPTVAFRDTTGDWSEFSHVPWDFARNPRSPFGEYLFLSRQAPGELQLSFPVRLSRDIRITSPENMSVRVQRAACQGTTCQKPAEDSASSVAVALEKQTDDPQERLLRMRFRPSEVDHDWAIYRIQIGTGESNTDLPPWLSDWSTDSDATPDAGNKTFQLRQIVQSMMRSIAEKQILLSQYVAVARKD